MTAVLLGLLRGCWTCQGDVSRCCQSRFSSRKLTFIALELVAPDSGGEDAPESLEVLNHFLLVHIFDRLFSTSPRCT